MDAKRRQFVTCVPLASPPHYLLLDSTSSLQSPFTIWHTVHHTVDMSAVHNLRPPPPAQSSIQVAVRTLQREYISSLRHPGEVEVERQTGRGAGKDVGEEKGAVKGVLKEETARGAAALSSCLWKRSGDDEAVGSVSAPCFLTGTRSLVGPLCQAQHTNH